MINKAKYEESTFNAKLHGLKMKPYLEPKLLSSEDSKAADEAALKMFERMKGKHLKEKALNNG